MQIFRRLSQILFFSLFLLLFLQATFPYESLLPADLFLRADPLVAFIMILSTGKLLVGKFIIAIIILVLTIALGRFFCGWICPMGSMIDLGDRLSNHKDKKKRSSFRNYRWWKYSLLVAMIVAAIFSLQFIWFFDPISLITRSFTLTIYPLFSFFIESAFNLMARTGIFGDALFSLYDKVRGSVLPLEPLFFRKSVIIFFLFVGILLLGKMTRRFWCRYACPLGALYALFSKFRLTKRIVTDRCIDCGRCYRECKMDAINDDYRTFSHFECIECMHCVTVCPTDAFEYKFKAKPTSERVDLTRRRIIFSGVAGLFVIGVTRTGFTDKAHAGEIIRAPGSLPEPEFLDRCIRCHECVKICSTTGKYLQPAWLESGWEGIWTPIGDARHGYCEYDCNLCGKVCPTGAIHPVQLEDKKKLPLGTAYFDKSRCIPWYRHEDCLVCEEHCPTPEKAIKFESREVKRVDGTMALVKYPYVDENLCIGCGICATKCPIDGKAGIFLTGARQQRWLG